jgi:hypothetical protein
VIVWVSALVVTVALLGLPGCKKNEGPAKPKAPTKNPTKGIE